MVGYIKTALVMAAVVAATPSFAQAFKRENNQERRIVQGERSGALTKGEAVHMQHQQDKIDRNAAMDRARNGGTLTAGEKEKLAARQNAASANIYEKKHNSSVQ